MDLVTSPRERRTWEGRVLPTKSAFKRSVSHTLSMKLKSLSAKEQVSDKIQNDAIFITFSQSDLDRANQYSPMRARGGASTRV